MENKGLIPILDGIEFYLYLYNTLRLNLYYSNLVLSSIYCLSHSLCTIKYFFSTLHVSLIIRKSQYLLVASSRTLHPASFMILSFLRMVNQIVLEMSLYYSGTYNLILRPGFWMDAYFLPWTPIWSCSRRGPNIAGVCSIQARRRVYSRLQVCLVRIQTHKRVFVLN